jgi:YfiH family protein
LIFRKDKSVPFYQFHHLSEFTELKHAVFTRIGGVSTGPYRSLNLCRSVGDSETKVLKNRRIIQKRMGNMDLIFCNQVHGAEILSFSMHACSSSIRDRLQQADAMITNAHDVLLTIQVADCQAVLLHDPAKRVIANLHSGWRGSIQNIIGSVVKKMTEDFGTNPSDVIAGIGPSLGPCCAEFVNYRKEIPEQFHQFKINSDHFDFWRISRFQLMEAGVRDNNIQCAELCTRCRTDHFYSYRGEKNTGRFVAVIGLG